ncbi:hypothetical protein EV360DRAFT_86288 [Lentinula raphanica]|nr:hypothetical protein EV360DRAFT_86288 [Lentinula raphanica]
MSLFILRPAVFLLATTCAYPSRAQAEAPLRDGMVFGPDSNGTCYEGSAQGPVIPCPTKVYPHLPKAVIAAIVVAVVFGAPSLRFLIILLILLLLWRQQVRASTDDSASSLFDFVPATGRPLSATSNMSELRSHLEPPSSSRLSLRTMIGSQSVINEKQMHDSESTSESHLGGTHGLEADLEGSSETLTADGSTQ